MIHEDGRTGGLTYVMMLRGDLRDYANAAKKRMTCEAVMCVWFAVRGHASAPKGLKQYFN